MQKLLIPVEFNPAITFAEFPSGGNDEIPNVQYVRDAISKYHTEVMQRIISTFQYASSKTHITFSINLNSIILPCNAINHSIIFSSEPYLACINHGNIIRINETYVRALEVNLPPIDAVFNVVGVEISEPQKFYIPLNATLWGLQTSVNGYSISVEDIIVTDDMRQEVTYSIDCIAEVLTTLIGIEVGIVWS